MSDIERAAWDERQKKRIKALRAALEDIANPSGLRNGGPSAAMKAKAALLEDEAEAYERGRTRFGALLRSKREKSGATMGALAVALGRADVAFISDLERGKRFPISVSLIRRVCSFLGVPTEEILDFVEAAKGDGILEDEL